MSREGVPQSVAAIKREIKRFLDTVDARGKSIGNSKYGVYVFYDYDGEPIYVGQTAEKLRARIGRHLTNQRTDAVAMNVLDPFEVAEIEVWPLDLTGARRKSWRLCPPPSTRFFKECWLPLRLEPYSMRRTFLKSLSLSCHAPIGDGLFPTQFTIFKSIQMSALLAAPARLPTLLASSASGTFQKDCAGRSLHKRGAWNVLPVSALTSFLAIMPTRIQARKRAT